MAKVIPVDGELLCSLYYRIKTDMEYYQNKHQEISVIVEEDYRNNWVLVKSLNMQESVN